jgi:hypothetical protein
MRNMNKLAASFSLLTLIYSPSVLRAQSPQFTVDGRTVEIHGFASQGFAYSNENNFLTMKTSQGTPAMTDFGANISTRVTDRFRVGAQIYDRNIGDLGNWHPSLDWAFGDYKFKDWFGVRAGKVKTVLGLYNDTQDVDSLHTFALLPQSVYPLDLRASTIAHVGVDVYGEIGLKKLGSISYTGYVGSRPFDQYGGYVYGLSSLGLNVKSMSARQTGGDLRWNTPFSGLQVGVSYLNQPATLTGTADLHVLAPAMFPSSVLMPYKTDVRADNRTQFYSEYKWRRLTLDGEYARETVAGSDTTGTSFAIDQRSWYIAGAFRVSKRLELGTYHSRYYPDWKQTDFSAPINHIYDQVVTANVSLKSYWSLKLEGHFLDGYGEPYSFQGFYPQNNPQGLKPKTNMFVARTGFTF